MGAVPFYFLWLKSLLSASHPSYTQITERGVQQGKGNLEKPVGNYKGEDKGYCVFLSQMVEGYEIEDGCIYELAYYG